MLDDLLSHPVYAECRIYEMLVSRNHVLAEKRWDHGWDISAPDTPTVNITDKEFIAWEEAVLRIHTRIR